MDAIAMSVPGVDLGLKTFINVDHTVDGEIRISDIPEDWRTEEGIPEVMALLSQILRQLGVIAPGEEGGAYWISIGVRFGPQNDAEVGDLAELYKRYRGMFQIASYPTDAGQRSGEQNAIVAFGHIVRSLMERRGLPPAVVFVRLTWMPDGNRPGHFKGEKGGTEKQKDDLDAKQRERERDAKARRRS
jgi:hypothetical protein